MLAYVKTPNHSFQNKLKNWNINEKKYQKMEVIDFLYFALVQFQFDAIYSMILDFVSWSVYLQLIYFIVYIPYWSIVKPR